MVGSVCWQINVTKYRAFLVHVAFFPEPDSLRCLPCSINISFVLASSANTCYIICWNVDPACVFISIMWISSNPQCKINHFFCTLYLHMHLSSFFLTHTIAWNSDSIHHLQLSASISNFNPSVFASLSHFRKNIFPRVEDTFSKCWNKLCSI
jgi:hypothetical protein